MLTERLLKICIMCALLQCAVLSLTLFTPMADNSLVISAPTGSGKTAIFEMAIVRLLSLADDTSNIINNKIIYISPIKALCQERLVDWHKKFTDFGVRCISSTGDDEEIDPRILQQYNLIISTPEKWDVLSRRWRDNQNLIGSISLFLIDEVHLLNADHRGSTLEVIVSRMKTAVASLMLNGEQSSIRFIALSATIPNIEDIAEWLGQSEAAKYFKFSEEVRPVKLNKVVLGYHFNPQQQSTFKFDMSLSYKLPPLILKYSGGKPTLIFCNTRKSVEMTANHLVSNLQIRLSQEQKQNLVQISQRLSDAKLKQYIVHGIAFHHAGMVPENRYKVEESFRQGCIPVLVTTSTLAMGVNLPAHLVIVKSTKCYSDGGFKDYDEVSVFQMIGRAGRSQFDSNATALILTSYQDKEKYEKMLACTQTIESNLHKHLTEHLNAEVVLRTITDLDVAMRWLSSTFLYVRARKSPEKYKLPAGLAKEKIDKKLLEMCQIDLNKLVKAGMVRMNQAIEVSPTVVGEIMARYYVAFETMKIFTQITGTEILIQILAIISKCKEFSEIYLRNNDKKCLNLLNKSTKRESNRFPLAGKIKTVDQKVNCIIQAVLGNLEINDQAIICDSVKIMRNCERLSKCLIAYLETREKCYNALLNSIILSKCFRVKLWENSPYVSKQLTGVGQVMSTALMKAGKTSIRELINTNPRHIELVVGRKAPFGNTLVNEASRLPQYTLSLETEDNSVEIVITLQNPNDIEENPTVSLDSVMTLLVGDDKNNVLLYEKYQHSYMLDNPEVRRSFEIDGGNTEFLKADFISDNFVGIDCSSKVEFSTNTAHIINQNSKKNCKQTFLDMYMHHAKKAYTYKKKRSDVPSVKLKKTPGKFELEKSNNKNVMPNDNKMTTRSSNGISKCTPCKKSQTENHEPYKQGDEGINANSHKEEPCVMKPKSTVHSATPVRTEDSVKPQNSKHKGPVMAKSLFRTKSKSKFSKKSVRKSKSSKSDNDTVLSESQMTAITNDLRDKQLMDGELDISYATFEKKFDEDSEKQKSSNNLTEKNILDDLKSYQSDKCNEERIENDRLEICPVSQASNVTNIKSNTERKSKFSKKSLKKTKSLKGCDDDSALTKSQMTAIMNELQEDKTFMEEADLAISCAKFKEKVGKYSIKESNSDVIERNIPDGFKSYQNGTNDEEKIIESDELAENSVSDPSNDTKIDCSIHKRMYQVESTNADNANKGKVNILETTRRKQPFNPAKTINIKENILLNIATHSDQICNKDPKLKNKINLKGDSTSCTNDHFRIFGEMSNCRQIDTMQKKYSQLDFGKHGSKLMEDTTNKNGMERPDSTVGKKIQCPKSPNCSSRQLTPEMNKFTPFPQKCIKWRSPLVHSPTEKFSPQMQEFSFNFGNVCHEDTKESNEFGFGPEDGGSTSSLSSTVLDYSEAKLNSSQKFAKKKSRHQFPLSDQACLAELNQSFKRKLEDFEDICDVDYFCLNKRQKSQSNLSASSKSSLGQYYSQLLNSHKNKTDPEPQVKKNEKPCSQSKENNSFVQNIEAEVSTNNLRGINVSLEGTPSQPQSTAYNNNDHDIQNRTNQLIFPPHLVRSNVPMSDNLNDMPFEAIVDHQSGYPQHQSPYFDPYYSPVYGNIHSGPIRYGHHELVQSEVIPYCDSFTRRMEQENLFGVPRFVRNRLDQSYGNSNEYISACQPINSPSLASYHCSCNRGCSITKNRRYTGCGKYFGNSCGLDQDPLHGLAIDGFHHRGHTSTDINVMNGNILSYPSRSSINPCQVENLIQNERRPNHNAIHFPFDGNGSGQLSSKNELNQRLKAAILFKESADHQNSILAGTIPSTNGHALSQAFATNGLRSNMHPESNMSSCRRGVNQATPYLQNNMDQAFEAILNQSLMQQGNLEKNNTHIADERSSAFAYGDMNQKSPAIAPRNDTGQLPMQHSDIVECQNTQFANDQKLVSEWDPNQMYGAVKHQDNIGRGFKDSSHQNCMRHFATEEGLNALRLANNRSVSRYSMNQTYGNNFSKNNIRENTATKNPENNMQFNGNHFLPAGSTRGQIHGVTELQNRINQSFDSATTQRRVLQDIGNQQVIDNVSLPFRYDSDQISGFRKPQNTVQSATHNSSNIFGATIQNNKLAENKHYINQFFSPAPKKQLNHLGINSKHIDPKITNSRISVPSSQSRILNFNSFEERLNNMISSRSQDRETSECNSFPVRHNN